MDIKINHHRAVIETAVEKVRVMDNTNVGLMGVLEGEKRMAENFPELMKDTSKSQ